MRHFATNTDATYVSEFGLDNVFKSTVADYLVGSKPTFSVAISQVTLLPTLIGVVK